MKGRGNDLADCFTARVGKGYGLGVRTQVSDYIRFAAGIGSYAGRWVGYLGREKVDKPVKQIWFGEPFSLIFLTEVRWWWGFDAQYSFLGINDAEFSLDELYRYPRWSLFAPFIRKKFYIEVGATLVLVGFDLGFNPAELVDFLLGWFFIDISGDDTREKKKKPSARR